MRRIAHNWIAGLALVFAFCGPAIADDAPDLSRAWFMPALAVNNDPNCTSILAAARAQFATNADWNNYSGPLAAPVIGFTLTRTADGTVDHDPSVQINSDDGSVVLVAKDGSRLLLRFVIDHGCGGVCDGEHPEVGALSPAGAESASMAAVPSAPSWAIYATGGEHYLVGLVDGHLEAYQFTTPGNLRIACRVILAPENLLKSSDGEVQSALQAVDALNTASLGMSRAGGSFCGTMETDARWENDVRDALRLSLYRPWATGVNFSHSGASGAEFLTSPGGGLGDYGRIYTSLTQWSLGGLSEHASFQTYQGRIEQTQKILSAFYVKKFGWPQTQASSMAESALTNAIARGYNFGQLPDNPVLRAAILERRPMDEVRAIPFTGQSADADSLLNIAILYPEALSYLLEKGLNPNQANVFGKTPLMYAAQYNQPAAVRLLLQHGADPNARTVAMEPQCGFDIRTTSMTALHYAARYGSAELMRLLVQNGGVTFIQAHNNDWPSQKRAADETPLDWLMYYTSSKDERNSFVAVDELPALETILRAPGPGTITSIAQDQAIRGDKALMVGDFEAGYQALHLALAADPTEQKAISDLPLAALKTGRLGEAAAAAKSAAETLKSPAEQAGAWFNLGLTCERAAALKPNQYWVEYDGNEYCETDGFAPFLSAWRLNATTARTNKLIQVLKSETGKSGEPGICIVGGSVYRFAHGSSAPNSLESLVTRVYALHSVSDKIDPSAIQWTINWADKPATTISPQIVAQYMLGGEALTVLESKQTSGPPSVAGAICR